MRMTLEGLRFTVPHDLVLASEPVCASLPVPVDCSSVHRALIICLGPCQLEIGTD